MAQSESTANDFIEVRIAEPGDDCNLYVYDPNLQGLRLSGIYRATHPAPVDIAVIPDTSPDGEADLDVLLVGHRANPPGSIISVRPIAIVQTRQDAMQSGHIVAIPAADDRMTHVRTLDDLPEGRREAIIAYARANTDGHTDSALLWGDATRAQQVIHAARQATRLARAKAQQNTVAPKWKPLGYRVAGARQAAETEPHSEAEYAYSQLPDRFQRYVNEYLAHNERILFAVRRPAMKSMLQRTFLSREMLQEGILFITDQQVALVTEVTPLSQNNIRFGYVVHTGVPEHIVSATARPASQEIHFEVTWQAISGLQNTIWEFPADAMGELNEAVKILSQWQPRVQDRRLRRACGPEPHVMELHDPAANDPADTVPIAMRLTETVIAGLSSSEQVLARALLPAWADKHKTAYLFAITNRRVLLVPDPNNPYHLKSNAYPLQSIASIEFQYSYLGSWITLNMPQKGKCDQAIIEFPNTATAFRVCLETLRRQLMAIHL